MFDQQVRFDKQDVKAAGMVLQVLAGGAPILGCCNNAAYLMGGDRLNAFLVIGPRLDFGKNQGFSAHGDNVNLTLGVLFAPGNDAVTVQPEPPDREVFCLAALFLGELAFAFHSLSAFFMATALS